MLVSALRAIETHYDRAPITVHQVVAHITEPVHHALIDHVLDWILQVIGIDPDPCTRHKEREDAQEYDTPKHMYLETYEHD